MRIPLETESFYSILIREEIQHLHHFQSIRSEFAGVIIELSHLRYARPGAIDIRPQRASFDNSDFTRNEDGGKSGDLWRKGNGCLLLFFRAHHELVAGVALVRVNDGGNRNRNCDNVDHETYDEKK